MTGAGYSLTDAMSRSGATYRQLDYWVRRNYLRPVGGYGSGNQRLWPVAEVEVAAKMVTLVEAGMTVERAADVARTSVVAGAERVRLSPAVVVEFEREGVEVPM